MSIKIDARVTEKIEEHKQMLFIIDQGDII
jgi:hypothetical protein